MNAPQLFRYGDMALEYRVYGTGPQKLLYFHGFGKNADEFDEYGIGTDIEFTVYAFSFFHHGRSLYPETRVDRQTLRPEELSAILFAFINEHHIERFSLMGYSMGGKICLSLFNSFHTQIDRLILAAPDGIHKNTWYRFTSRNKAGNALYRKIMHKPRFFFALMRGLRKIRLLKPQLHDFVFHQLETPEKRQLVYRVWMTLRHINPDAKKAAEQIKNSGVKTLLLYGRFDRVITLKPGRKFAQRCSPMAALHILDRGHKIPCSESGRIVRNFLHDT